MSSQKSNSDRQPLVRPPAHPIPQLQKPFEESMIESSDTRDDEDVPTDAMARRTMLLEAPTYERVIAGRWKQKPGEKYHPLWKLVAQLSFGMHLLAESMAISEGEVMRILQSHVDDIDGFLERTTDDFDLAQSDIHERIRCLKLPLAHGDIFDRMLEDRAFRASILDGNEKIDHVISRTKKAAKDALKDVQKGFDATTMLEKYLTKLNSTWKRDSPEHEAVLVAMLGNVEGWRQAFLELHLQGNKLAGSLAKLADIVSEMEQRAAIVSRNVLAKTQRHSQKAGRTQSQGTMLTEQKPLPSEPGRPSSTRPSSRSTQATGFTTRPNSGRKSGQGLTSHSPSGSDQAPRSPESRRKTRQDAGRPFVASAARASHAPLPQQGTQRTAEAGEAIVRASNSHPIELPADVPENLLLQAPVSVKNRLSMTLGLKPKNLSEHRVSSIYYPRALGDLLKSPAISSLLTPQSSQSKGTPVLAVTSQAGMPGGETDYFMSHEESLSIGMITPDSKNGFQSSRNSPRAVQGSASASIVGSTPATRRSSIRNPAFTSHPAVMAMALPPSELPANNEIEGRPSPSRSSKSSEPSILGEPGPEMAENTTTVSAPIPESRSVTEKSAVEDSIIPTTTTETSPTIQQQTEKPAQPESPEQAKQPEVSKEDAASPGTTPGIATVKNDEGGTELDSAKEAQEGLKAQRIAVAQGVDDARSATHFVAELEASTAEPPKTQPEKAFGPVELEAPFQTFRLPPRPREVSDTAKEVLRASITQLDDFFKLPTEHTIKPGMKPKDFGDSNSPQPIQPLKLKLAKKDGKMVPVQVTDSEDSEQTGTPGTKLSLKKQVVADIIETMSHTPPGSPIHSRSLSFTSASPAQRPPHRTSHSWGPPERAPPPPGPGGRIMISPDFAVAGQFQGERKQKKKSGAGSKSGWKSLFGGNTNAAHSPSSASLSTPPSQHSQSTSQSGSHVVPTTDMVTVSGNDLVWFRGDMTKAVGVSSA